MRLVRKDSSRVVLGTIYALRSVQLTLQAGGAEGVILLDFVTLELSVAKLVLEGRGAQLRTKVQRIQGRCRLNF